MSSLIIFPNFYDTTVDPIGVNSEAANINAITGNSRSGTAIDSDIAQYPVDYP